MLGDTFETFVAWYATYGYLVLFLGVFLENVGVPVPGETSLLVAGFLASPAGEARLHLGLVILLASVAAVCGDNLGYGLGHLARPHLLKGRSLLVLTPERLRAAERYFARYGAWTVFLARFVTGIRVIAAPAAGAAGMPWQRFLLANLAGAVTWATVMALLGYAFGRSWRALEHALGWGVWLVLVLLLLTAVVWFLWRRRQAPP